MSNNIHAKLAVARTAIALFQQYQNNLSLLGLNLCQRGRTMRLDTPFKAKVIFRFRLWLRL